MRAKKKESTSSMILWTICVSMFVTVYSVDSRDPYREFDNEEQRELQYRDGLDSASDKKILKINKEIIRINKEVNRAEREYNYMMHPPRTSKTRSPNQDIIDAIRRYNN